LLIAAIYQGSPGGILDRAMSDRVPTYHPAPGNELRQALPVDNPQRLYRFAK